MTVVVLLLAMLAIVVGLVLFTTGALGGTDPSASPSTAPAATSTSNAASNTHTVPGYYSIALPPQWGYATLPASSGDDLTNTLYTDPNGQDNIDVDVYRVGSANYPPTPDAADEGALASLDSHFSPSTSAPVPVTLNGTSFTERQASIMVKGQARAAVAYAAIHNGKMYVIVTSAPRTQYSAAGFTASGESTLFAATLQSFTFLS